MKNPQAYPAQFHQDPVIAIIAGVDQDLEHCEDTIMLGYMLVLAAPMFAPVAPPRILLPMMALAFLITVFRARGGFKNIGLRLRTSLAALQPHQANRLLPLSNVFAEHPKHTLTQGLNPLLNLKRTFNSLVGGLLINPFWMPIFYALGMHFVEDKQIRLLNRAICQLERLHGLQPSRE